MKKFFIFLYAFLLIIPVNLYAEECYSDGVTLQSVTMVDKSEYAKELTKARGRGTLLDLDIAFSKQNDYIKYNVVVKNNTDTNYVLDESMFNKDYSNVAYIFETTDKTVKAGQTRELELTVKLANMPTDDLFNETNTFNLNLTGGKISNPETGIKSLLYYLPVIAIIGITITLAVKRNKAFKVMVMFIGALVAIPLIVYAECKCNITIISTITVEKCKYRLRTTKGSFEEGKEVQEICLNEASAIEGEKYTNKLLYDYSNTYSDDNPYAFIYMENGDRSYREPFFGVGSYVKIYSDAAKTNLIKTITAKDLPGQYYDLNEGNYTGQVFELLIGQYSEIYYTLSPDLISKAMVYIDYGRIENLQNETDNLENHLLVTDQNKINAINHLSQSISDDTVIYFTNCTYRFPNEETIIRDMNGISFTEPILNRLSHSIGQEICEGNIYYAVWDIEGVGGEHTQFVE